MGGSLGVAVKVAVLKRFQQTRLPSAQVNKHLDNVVGCLRR